MENVFLDTSIFVSENFLGKRITSFLELCRDNYLQLVLSIITVNEVKSQYKKKARLAFDRHNELINDKEKVLRVLRNNTSVKDTIKKLPKVEDLCNEFYTKFDSKLKEAKAIIIEYPTINSEDIFKDYFEGKPPFNSTNKKHEFPDVIAIISIEKWCEECGDTCLLFSLDNDFKGRDSEFFEVRNDFDIYLENNLKRISPARIELVSALFNQDSENIDKDIREWVTNQLDDYTAYYEYTNWLDVHDVSIDEIKVQNKEYEIVSLNEEDVEIEIKAWVRVKVTLIVDDEETGIYDSEDKVMIYRDTTELVFEDEIELPINARFFIADENDFDKNIEIEEINDGKNIELNRFWRNY